MFKGKESKSIEAMEAPMGKNERKELAVKINTKARQIALEEQGESIMSEDQKKEVVEKINYSAKNVSGTAKGPTVTPSVEEMQAVNTSMHSDLHFIENTILGVRSFREKIDRIMNIIDLSGIQNELATRVKGFNPVEHSITHFVLAKGSLGELLKHLIPHEKLVGLKCYNNYVMICNELNEKPTYGDTIYPFLPNDYMNGLISAVEDALKNNVTLESNHEKWRKDKEAAGWVYGEVKDAEKKTHPSLVPFNELPDDDARVGERRKGEEFLRVINEFKNPYKYPKQVGSDVEEVTNSVVVNDLNIKLPEGKYRLHGTQLNHASQLNRVQMVDWIKSMISELLDEFIKFEFNSILRYRLKLYNKYNDKNIDPNLLSVINVQSVYTNLVDAKNIFGYSYQYFK